MKPDKLRQSHWETLFKTVDYTQVLWHQDSPKISLELIQESGVKKDGLISCAGLETIQYNDKKIKDELPLGLELIEYKKYIYTTPKNTEQKYS